MTGLGVGDIVVTGGTKGVLSGSGVNYSLPVTPTGPTVTAQVSASAAQDATGNSNTASVSGLVTYGSGNFQFVGSSAASNVIHLIAP